MVISQNAQGFRRWGFQHKLYTPSTFFHVKVSFVQICFLLAPFTGFIYWTNSKKRKKQDLSWIKDLKTVGHNNTRNTLLYILCLEIVLKQIGAFAVLCLLIKLVIVAITLYVFCRLVCFVRKTVKLYDVGKTWLI